MIHDLRCCANHDRDYGDLVGEAEETPQAVTETNGNSDQMDTEDSMQETEEVEEGEFEPQVLSGSTCDTTCRSLTDRRQEMHASEERDQPQPASETLAPHDNVSAAMPQAILNTGMF